MTKFQEFYSNVRVKDAEAVRHDIEELVSSVSFNNWRNGLFEPHVQFWHAINVIAEKYGYEKPYSIG